MSISIVLADDYELVRAGIRLLLERNKGLRVIGEANNGNEAVRLVRLLSPTVAVLDVSMPFGGGIEAARVIRKECPNTAVLMLSIYADDGHVLDAIGAGVHGYVLKGTMVSEFVRAVESVADHHFYLSPALSDRLIRAVHSGENSAADREQPLRKLSVREREILQLVVEGHSSTEIAAMLGLASATVDTYRSRLMAKLHINNVPHLVRFAIREGLLSLD